MRRVCGESRRATKHKDNYTQTDPAQEKSVISQLYGIYNEKVNHSIGPHTKLSIGNHKYFYTVLFFIPFC